VDGAIQQWVAAEQWVKDALHKDDEGQTLVEYALILVLIAVVVVISLTLVGTSVNNALNRVAVRLSVL
jgi:pilus assembly protein Flp/PilA